MKKLNGSQLEVPREFGIIQPVKELDQRRFKSIGFVSPCDGRGDLFFDLDDAPSLTSADIVSFQVKSERFVSQEGGHHKRKTYQRKAVLIERLPDEDPTVFNLRCRSTEPKDYLPCAQFFLRTLQANEQSQWLKARVSNLRSLSAEAWDAVLDEVLTDETIFKAVPDRCRSRLMERAAQTLASAAPSWTEADFDAKLREVFVLYGGAASTFARENGSQIALSAYNEIARHLIALIQMQVRTKQRDIASLGDADLGGAFAAIEQIKKAVESLVATFPKAKAECDHLVTDLEWATVARLVKGQIPAALAWQIQVATLVENHCEHVMQHTNIDGSLALAVAVLRFPKVAQLVRDRKRISGIVGLVAAIRVYAESGPNLKGSISFGSLSQEDLILAGRYSSDKKVMRLLEIENVRSLAGLRDKLDDHSYQQFLVDGIQPRIAELAFATIFKTVTGLDENLSDENLAALAKRGKLPPEDFSCADRTFDVKSNPCRFYAYRINAKIGLRGFQIGWKERSKTAELAGFVFPAANHFDATWSFVGFCAERDVPILNGRAAPFQFALPAHLDFPAWRVKDVEAQLLELLDEFEPNSHACPSFTTADRKALGHSLRARASKERVVERALWDEVTRALIDLRNGGGTEKEGYCLLDEHHAKAESRFWLHKMAAVGDTILLTRWIDEVLHTLNSEHDKVRCPICGGGRGFTLTPRGITSAGTVLGTFYCRCGLNKEATLIAHCRKCGKYPLVIGQNELCCSCMGLRCNSKSNDDQLCGACKCSDRRDGIGYSH